MLDSDLTVVGSDQLFNEMMGRFFQERFEQNKQVIMTTKITKGLWGEEKQSKSIGNFVALTDTSKDKFGKIMQLADDRIVEWMKVYTDISLEIIDEIDSKLKNDSINPRDAKMQLAHAIVTRYHGEEIANKEQSDFIATFSKKEFPDDAKVIEVDKDSINILDLLSICCISMSKSDMRRMVVQNAVSFNGSKVNDIYADLLLDSDNQLKVGKRLFFKVIKR